MPVVIFRRRLHQFYWRRPTISAILSRIKRAWRQLKVPFVDRVVSFKSSCHSPATVHHSQRIFLDNLSVLIALSCIRKTHQPSVIEHMPPKRLNRRLANIAKRRLSTRQSAAIASNARHPNRIQSIFRPLPAYLRYTNTRSGLEKKARTPTLGVRCHSMQQADKDPRIVFANFPRKAASL